MKVSRDVLGQIYGGKLVVALSVNTRLAIALDADADGETSVTPLLPDVVRQVRAGTSGVRSSFASGAPGWRSGTRTSGQATSARQRAHTRGQPDIRDIA